VETPFEELDVWKRARLLVQAVYRISSVGKIALDWGLRDQLRRAAISTMSNIAEGHSRGSPRTVRHFLRMARGSAGELKSTLTAAFDVGYLAEPAFDELAAGTDEVRRLLTSAIRELGGRPA
jgi:four helix bundle protein